MNARQTVLPRSQQNVVRNRVFQWLINALAVEISDLALVEELSLLVIMLIFPCLLVGADMLQILQMLTR